MPDPQARPKPKPPTFWQTLRALQAAGVAPVPSHASPPPTGLEALSKATGIGPSKVGERYVPSPADSPLQRLLQFVGGASRPRSVAAADPFGADAYLMGQGEAPGFTMGSVEPMTGLAAFAKGRGFYSRIEEALKLLPKSAHPNKVASILKANASAEELAFRQVPEFLASKGNTPVTAAELSAHLAAHPAPMPTVKVKGGPPSAKPMPPGYRIEPLAPSPGAPRGATQRNYTLIGPDGSGRAFYATDAADAQMMANDMLGLNTQDNTKFAQYQLPGGEQYRETLLTLPIQEQFDPSKVKIIRNRRSATQGSVDLEYDGHPLGRWADDGPISNNYMRPESELIEMAKGLWASGSKNNSVKPVANAFTSSHWDDPNVLVHTRANERTLPTGERGRFLEEVQSDWHQQGKEKGYQLPSEVTAPMDAEYRALVHKNAAAWEAGQTPLPADVARAQELEAALMRADNATTPDAPFKDAWPDLALKQQLLETAEDPNAQWLGLSSADTQIKRWGSERLRWTQTPTGNWRVTYEPQVGGDALAGQGIGDMGAAGLERGHITNADTFIRNEADLARLMGDKEKAAKAWKRLQAAPDGGEYLPRAEGFRQQYDENLRNKLAKMIGKFGGTVERAPLSGGRTKAQIDAEMDALHDAVFQGTAPAGSYQNQLNRLQAERETAVSDLAWLARLTPEMKRQIREKGLPLMSLAALAALGSSTPPKEAR